MTKLAIYRFGLAHERLRSWQAWLTGGLCVLLGIRLYLVGTAGNITPFLDQWSAEGERLFVPYLRGTLRWSDLFAAHNEHRIFFTRLISLAVIEATGSWNSILEMMIDAVLAVALVGAIAWQVRASSFTVISGFATVMLLLIFGLPFGIENILWGTQSQFSLLGLFAVATLALLTGRPVLGPAWWAGYVSAALGQFTMAAGLLALVAAAGTILLQLALKVRRRSGREYVALLLIAGLVLLLTRTLVTVPRHDFLRATGPIEFMLAFNRAAGWPIRMPLLAPLALNAPGLLLVLDTWRRRPDATDRRWRVIVLLIWCWLQSAVTAYSRSLTPDASRYLDDYAINVFLNFAALVILTTDRLNGLRNGTVMRRLAVFWITLVSAFLIVQMLVVTERMHWLLGTSYQRTASIAAFVRNDDESVFRGKPLLAIPFLEEDERRWTDLLRQPEIRGLLPEELGSTEAERAAVRARLVLHAPIRPNMDLTRKLATYAGGLLVAVGTALLMFLLAGSMAFFKEDRVNFGPAGGDGGPVP